MSTHESSYIPNNLDVAVIQPLSFQQAPGLIPALEVGRIDYIGDAYDNGAKLLGKVLNRGISEIFQRGPQAARNRILKHISGRFYRSGLLENSLLRQDCLQLMSYALPDNNTPATQLFTFKCIITLVTTYFSIPMRTILLQSINVEDNLSTYDTLVAMWRVPYDVGLGQLDFFLDLAASCLCQADGLALTVEAIEPSGTMRKFESGGQNAIDKLRIATESNRPQEAMISTRYLATIMADRAIWHSIDRIDVIQVIHRVCDRTTQLVQDLLVDGGSAAYALCDVDGTDALAHTVLVGIRDMRATPVNYPGNPWPKAFEDLIKSFGALLENVARAAELVTLEKCACFLAQEAPVHAHGTRNELSRGSRILNETKGIVHPILDEWKARLRSAPKRSSLLPGPASLSSDPALGVELRFDEVRNLVETSPRRKFKAHTRRTWQYGVGLKMSTPAVVAEPVAEMSLVERLAERISRDRIRSQSFASATGSQHDVGPSTSTLTATADSVQAESNSRLRETSDASAVDRYFETEIDDEYGDEDDRDFIESNANEDRNRPRQASIFAGGSVSRYGMKDIGPKPEILPHTRATRMPIE